jgi:hypothetical protein
MTKTKGLHLAIAIPQAWIDYEFDVELQAYECKKRDRHYRVAAKVLTALEYGYDWGNPIPWSHIEAALTTTDKARGYHQPQPLCDLVQTRLFDAYQIREPARPSRFVSSTDSWEYVVLDGDRNEVEHTTSLERIYEMTGRRLTPPTIQPPAAPLTELLPVEEFQFQESAPIKAEALQAYWQRLEECWQIVEANGNQITWQPKRHWRNLG